MNQKLPVAHLYRSYTPFGVIGQLHIDAVQLTTLERPWAGNRANVSCIPKGDYLCKRIVSPKFGETFEITGVPGRTHILYHALNKIHESQGCVGVGLAIQIAAGELFLSASKNGMRELMTALDGVDAFRLFIGTFNPE